MTKYQLGLIGYPLSHSFSKKYFSKKFEKEQIGNFHYELFPIENIDLLPELLIKQPNLLGLNVTIPYKQQILAYLDEIDEEAEKIGAVNTIEVKAGKLKGYNTDIHGFEISLIKLLEPFGRPRNELKALILGTGGAAKAVAYVLEKLGISYQFVSRKEGRRNITYNKLTKRQLKIHHLIINTTPLGMAPKVETLPELPYEALTRQHFLYDLVYNPQLTEFLKQGLEKKATVINGLKMLHLQAEKAWSIWTKEMELNHFH